MAEIVAMERSGGKESASRDQDPSLSIFLQPDHLQPPTTPVNVPLLGRSLVAGAREL